MQITAMAPTYVCKTQVPQSVVDNEKEILLTQIKNDPKSANKPEAIIAKMVEGRVSTVSYTHLLQPQVAFAFKKREVFLPQNIQ